MKTLNVIHKDMSDEEAYQEIKAFWKEHPELHDLLMLPKEWRKQRLEKLQREGKLWSKG